MLWKILDSMPIEFKMVQVPLLGTAVTACLKFYGGSQLYQPQEGLLNLHYFFLYLLLMVVKQNFHQQIKAKCFSIPPVWYREKNLEININIYIVTINNAN